MTTTSISHTLPGERPTRLSRIALRRQLVGFAYTLPTLVFIVVFFLTPLLLVARMSLNKWGLLTGDEGFNFPKNFVSIWRNQLFWPSVWFTVQYTVIVTVMLLGLGLGLALLVQSATRWTGFLRTVFLLPVSLGLAAASLLAYGFYSPAIGPISPPLEALGLIDNPIAFLGTSFSALLSTTFLVVWKFAGFYMLVLLVGLQGIPDDLYEAASLDGASKWQTFRYLTLPLLRPSLSLATDPLHHRLAARLRPVLHPDQGRARQHHGDGGAGDLSRGLPAPEPRHRRRTLDPRPGGPGADQRIAIPVPARNRAGLAP